MDRRQMLLACCSACTVSIAGCSSDDDDEKRVVQGQPINNSNATGGQPNGTGNGSTEGDDDSPFEGPAEELPLLTIDDLPRSDWEATSESSIAPDSDVVAAFDHAEQDTEVVSSVDFFETVSDARTDFGETRDTMEAAGEDSSAVVDLEIASESFRALAGTFVAFRDANAVGSVLIDGSGSVFETLDPKALATTMHSRWR